MDARRTRKKPVGRLKIEWPAHGVPAREQREKKIPKQSSTERTKKRTEKTTPRRRKTPADRAGPRSRSLTLVPKRGGWRSPVQRSTAKKKKLTDPPPAKITVELWKRFGFTWRVSSICRAKRQFSAPGVDHFEIISGQIADVGGNFNPLYVSVIRGKISQNANMRSLFILKQYQISKLCTQTTTTTRRGGGGVNIRA